MASGKEIDYRENENVAKVNEWMTAEGYTFINTRREYDSLGNLTFQHNLFS